MISTGGVLAYAILLHMAILMWCLPRRLGGVGLLAGQFFSFGAWAAVLSISIVVGEVDYKGCSSLVGIAFDAFLFNLVLLPAGVTAAALRSLESKLHYDKAIETG
ncbi:MAG: hypothetical protein KDA80_05485 [Planctomycetaceae bacterium]|nr:hypothetical protein [Planctomycetaceae bacterium]